MINKVNLLFCFFILIFNSCSTKPTVCKTSNTVGVWNHYVSKNMGGYLISQTSELVIKRYGPGDYEYFLYQTTIDQMYGGQPKYFNSKGGFKDQIIDNKWRFDGGDFGKSKGYIEVPSDCWDNYKPNRLIVSFPKGNGNTMIFTKN
jgi:hypothetical protein